MREQLIGAVLDFLEGHPRATLDEIRTALGREIDAAGPDALDELAARLSEDNGWGYHPPDPLVRRIHHVLAETFLDHCSEVLGSEHLRQLGSTPVVMMANHVSYADANVMEVLLRRAGAGDFADRLTALAGPKVFSSRRRRFSSLCFGTVKVPQSTDVASEEATLNPREVARAARQSIDAAHARLSAGDALLLFGEGTRSRTGEMGPMLVGAARYLEAQGTIVLPVAQTGPEVLFPVDAPTVSRARAVLRLGTPLPLDALMAAADGNRRVIMDALGLAIAEMLPPAYRGVYGDASAFTAARQALDRLRYSTPRR